MGIGSLAFLLNTMHKQLILLSLLLLLGCSTGWAQRSSFAIARLKYGGGGDWYANKTALPNLITFCNRELKANIKPQEESVEPGSPEIFDYPFVHMTGHGNVVFTEAEVQNLRKYLTSGGFLHIDDNYGLDKFARREMKKIFPDLDFIELPFNHPVYHQKFDFPRGLPKIHEHDNKPPQGFGIIYQGRLVCFYSYESDLGNGWEDQSVHNDPIEKHQAALRMGANLISYALTSF